MRGRWVFISSYSQSRVIDILVISSKLGAALHYLHKYPLPGFGICDAHSRICVLRGPGEFTLLASHSLTLLTFVWFRQVGSHLPLSSQVPTPRLLNLRCISEYMCLTRARWVYINSCSQSHVIDVCVVLTGWEPPCSISTNTYSQPLKFATRVRIYVC